MAARDTGARKLGRALDGPTAHEKRRGQLVAVERIEEARQAGAHAIGEQLLHAQIAHAGRHDAGHLADALIVRVAILDGELRTLLVVDVDRDGEPRAVRPLRRGLIEPVSDEIALAHGKSSVRFRCQDTCLTLKLSKGEDLPTHWRGPVASINLESNRDRRPSGSDRRRRLAP